MTRITRVTLIAPGMKSFQVESSHIDPNLSLDERIAFYKEEERKEEEARKEMEKQDNIMEEEEKQEG